MLEIIDINTYYGTSQILHGLSLDLKTGEMEGILGRNGAGKTTLLRSVIGINPPRTGTIRFNGHDITHLKPYQRTKFKIAYVPQGREIIPDLSVYDNLRLAVIAQGDRKGKIPDFVFDYFPRLKDIQKRKAGFLSGGEQQQLAIGRALAQQPDLLLLDEPTEGLQPSVVEEIENDIKLIHKEHNNTILIVEQRLDFIRELTDRFSIIENGRIAVRGATSELTDEIIKKHLSV